MNESSRASVSHLWSMAMVRLIAPTLKLQIKKDLGNWKVCMINWWERSTAIRGSAASSSPSVLRLSLTESMLWAAGWFSHRDARDCCTRGGTYFKSQWAAASGGMWDIRGSKDSAAVGRSKWHRPAPFQTLTDPDCPFNPEPSTASRHCSPVKSGTILTKTTVNVYLSLVWEYQTHRAS